MGFVLIGCLLLAGIHPKNRRIPREAVIGIVYGLALVASIMAADKISRGNIYLKKTLSGYMLWANWPLVLVTAFFYILMLAFHYKYRHKFIALVEPGGKVEHEKLWDFLFFTTQGVITVLIVPVAGVLLAYGFLMIPAAIGSLFTRKWAAGIAIGWSVGFGACLLGLFSSYHFDKPYGPTLLLSLGFFFVLALIVRAVRGRGRERGRNSIHG
jgi:zinc/manganese transport system permease protein